MQWDRARQVTADVIERKDQLSAPELESQRWLDLLCFS